MTRPASEATPHREPPNGPGPVSASSPNRDAETGSGTVDVTASARTSERLRPRPAAAAAAAGEGGNPRSVTPGIEAQDGRPEMPEPGVYAGLDWLRLTGPESIADRALPRLLVARFGEASRETSGAKWFDRGRLWEPGVLLSAGHADRICMIDVQGQRLRTMTVDDSVRLLHDLMMLGMRPTRIDCAVDWIDQGVDLHPKALRSCERGELCRVRRWADDSEFMTDGHPTRRLLKLGKRESAVCGRIYDKGMEQRVAGCGRWERLEIELKSDRAMQAAHAIAEAPTDGVARIITELAVGAIDFREKNGRSELDRRSRAAWWAELIDDIEPRPLSPMANPRSFDQWLGWFRRSVGPRVLQLAQLSGMGAGEFMATMLDGVVPMDRMDDVARVFIEGRQRNHDSVCSGL